jgi:hypothetical protein
MPKPFPTRGNTQQAAEAWEVATTPAEPFSGLAPQSFPGVSSGVTRAGRRMAATSGPHGVPRSGSVCVPPRSGGTNAPEATRCRPLRGLALSAARSGACGGWPEAGPHAPARRGCASGPRAPVDQPEGRQHVASGVSPWITCAAMRPAPAGGGRDPPPQSRYFSGSNGILCFSSSLRSSLSYGIRP